MLCRKTHEKRDFPRTQIFVFGRKAGNVIGLSQHERRDDVPLVASNPARSPQKDAFIFFIFPGSGFFPFADRKKVNTKKTQNTKKNRRNNQQSPHPVIKDYQAGITQIFPKTSPEFSGSQIFLHHLYDTFFLCERQAEKKAALTPKWPKEYNLNMGRKDKTKKETSIDDLARMVQDGFMELKGEIKEVKSDTENIKANLNKKVNQFEHNELIYRVEKLEKKF